MIKLCPKCKTEKSFDQFYKNPKSSNGLSSYCKSCICKTTYESFLKRPIEERRKIGRSNYHVKKDSPSYRIRISEKQKRRRLKYPEKFKARKKVWHEIKAGRMQREPCEFCGSTIQVQAHHHDYLKPLEVRWMCAPCHRKYHGTQSF